MNMAQASHEDAERFKPHRAAPDPRASKVIISLSGFSAAEREVLQDWVVRLGAGYSGPLVCRLSTHLVCRDLLAVFGTEKYHKALMWNITLVSFRWVYDSLQAGRLQKYDDYKSDKPSPAYNALRQEARRRQEIAVAAIAAVRRPLQALSLNSGADENMTSLGAGGGGVCSKLKRPLQQSNTSPGPAAQSKCEALRDRPITQEAASHKEVGARSRSHGGEFTFIVPCPSSSPVRSSWLRTTPTDQPTNLQLPPNQPAPTTHPTPTTVSLTLDELQDMHTIIVDAKDMPVAGARGDNVANKDASTGHRITASNSFHGFCVSSRCGAVQSSPVDLASAFETARAAAARCGAERPAELPSTILDQVQKAANSALGGDPSWRPTSSSGFNDLPSSDMTSEADASDAMAVDGSPPNNSSVPGAQSPPQGGPSIAPPWKSAGTEMAHQPLQLTGVVTAGVLYSGFEPGLADIATAGKGRRMVRADGRVANNSSGCHDAADKSLEDLADVENLQDTISDDATEEEEPFATGALWERSRGPKDVSQGAQVVAAQGSAAVAVPLVATAPSPLQLRTASASGAQNVSVGGHHAPAAELGTGAPLDTECGSPAAESAAQEPLTPAAERQDTGAQPSSVARESLMRLLLKIKPDPGMEEAEVLPVGPVAGLASRLQGAAGPQVPQPAGATSVAATSIGNNIKQEPGEQMTAPAVGPASGLLGRSVAHGAGERPPQASARRRAAALATSSLISEPQPMRRPSRSGSISFGEEQGREGVQRATDHHRGELPADMLDSKDDDSESSMDGSPLRMRDIAELDDNPSCSFESSMLAGREHARLSTSNPAREAMEGDGDPEARKSLAVGRPQVAGARAGSRGIAPIISAAAVAAAAPHPTTSTSFISSASAANSDYQVEGQWQAVALVDTWSISKHLRHAVKMAEEFLEENNISSGGFTVAGVDFIKWLSRPPRGNTVRERHPGTVLKKVDFADQVTVEPLRLPINCRERTKKALCPIIALPPADGGDDGGSQGRREMFVVDPRLVYRMPSGEWWLEYHRYYTENDMAAIGAAIGRAVSLPFDFDKQRELMRDTNRAHCRLSYVRGIMAVVRTKKSPAAGRSGSERPVFTRYSFDSRTGEVVTDQPVSDLVIDT